MYMHTGIYTFAHTHGITQTHTHAHTNTNIHRHMHSHTSIFTHEHMPDKHTCANAKGQAGRYAGMYAHPCT